MYIISLISIVFCVINGLSGQVSTASYKYRQFLENRDILNNKIKEYIEYEKDRLIDLKKSTGYEEDITYINILTEQLEDLLKRVERNNTQKVEDSIDDVITHPVKAYINIKDFIINYRAKFLNKTHYTEKYRKVLDCPFLNTPHYSDQRDAIYAILRVQVIHQLPVTDIMAGTFMGRNSPVLNAADASLIGAYAHGLHYMPIALEWLEWTWKSLNGDVSNAVFNWHDTLRRLIFIYNSLRKDDKEIEGLIQQGADLEEKTQTGNLFYKLGLKYRQNKLPREANHMPPGLWEKRRKLCTQQHYVAEYKSHHLRCKYRPAMDVPTYNIYKEEVLNNKPYIGIIHGVLSDGEVEELKDVAGPKLIFDQEIDRSFGEIANLNTSDDYITRLVSGKLTSLLRFASQPEDQIKVRNYGFGGQKEENQRVLSQNDIGASLVLFLSDIEEGSHLIFDKLYISITPQKGSMVYWFSKDPKEIDVIRRQKYSCPVVFGEKWEMEYSIKVPEFTKTCKRKRKSKRNK